MVPAGGFRMKYEAVDTPLQCRYRLYELDACGEFDWVCTHPDNRQNWCPSEVKMPDSCPLEDVE